MMAEEPAVKINNLKRRRARESVNASSFSAFNNEFGDITSLDLFEHYRGRLQETLDSLISMRDAIHDLLSDNDYEEDIKACEEYVEEAKRAIQKASRRMDYDLSASTTRLNIHGPTQPKATVPIGLVTYSENLPAIKLEHFAGNFEIQSRFWEQFLSSIDEDASLQAINMHVFRR